MLSIVLLAMERVERMTLGREWRRYFLERDREAVNEWSRVERMTFSGKWRYF
jgi:hypothetical protein